MNLKRAVTSLLGSLAGLLAGVPAEAQDQQETDPMVTERCRDDTVCEWANNTRLTPLPREGQTASAGIGQVGERLTKEDAAPSLQSGGRISSRIQNRINTRIDTRIDRDLDVETRSIESVDASGRPTDRPTAQGAARPLYRSP